MVEELRPERSLSHSPIFQVMFMLQNTPPRRAGVKSLSISPQQFNSKTEKFDLTLSMVEDKDKLTCVLSYNTDLFDVTTVARMAEHLRGLFGSMAAGLDEPITSMQSLTESERQQLLVEWSRFATDYPAEKRAHDLFEQQAEQRPDALAVVYEGRHLTYSELNAKANQLAHYLRKQRVGPETLVGVSVERSLELIIALLGVIKAGGAYVPLDPSYPGQRLSYILEDAGAPILLTLESLSVELDPNQTRVIRLDFDWGAIAAESPQNPVSESGAGNLAYVMYTSGSTGGPKGVAIEHRNAGSLIHWAKEVFTREELEGVLASTSICFDLSVFELFVTLSWGGKVVLAENALQLPDLLAASEVTLVNTVPSAMAELMRMRGVPASVRAVNLAGEPLPTRLVNDIYEQKTIERVFDLYGPSESTTYSTFALRRAMAPATIGRPISNTQVYLLDSQMHPAPVGVSGQLYIGGDGLARCYLERPELTGEKWVPNPFSESPGERLYKTGDLGRWRADGTIEFLGRNDFQVKIRGYRIELEEIEARLVEREGIREAVVIAREDTVGDQRLVAYYTVTEASGAGKEGIGAEQLRLHLSSGLPEYMVPAAYVRLEKLPLTANGKVDRKALPEPEARPESREYQGPRNAIEEIVGGIWREVLALERVGVDENFFELGGHSLLATRVVSRVRDAFDVELRLKTLFEKPTVAGLAEVIQLNRVSGSNEALGERLTKSFPRADRGRDIPLSYAQQRLWFIDQMEPGSPAYNIPCAVRLTGSLDADALRRSLDEVIRRHEALRTSFPLREGQPVQQISPDHKIRLEELDLSEMGERQRVQRVKELIREETSRGFDLARGPVIRGRLLRLGSQEHALIVTTHHIVSDGWSIGLMIKEFAQLYEAFKEGKPSPLAELEVQYADYAVWQREWLSGEVLQSQLEYWSKQLEGITVLELPTDRARPATISYRGASEGFVVPAELTRDLNGLSRREGLTMFMTLLAGFQMMLSRYSGQDDIAVGTPIAGRSRVEIEGLIGFFVNTLVMRTKLTGEPTVREALSRVREMALEAHAHQDLPFERLVEELQPDRSLSHTPVFQVMFTLQNAPEGRMRMEGMNISDQGFETDTEKFDLTLSVVEGSEKLFASLSYNTDLFDSTTVARMAGHLQGLLASMVEGIDEPVMSLKMLAAFERQQIFVEWNDTFTPYPARLAHKMFQEQARRSPEAVAVCYEDEAVSYEELDARANQLARYMISRGVVAESVVGVCLDRSVELVVAVLGALKSGAAYLPLDAGYPAERLGYMLEDSRAAVTLTQQGLAQRLPMGTAEVILVDQQWDEIGLCGRSSPEAEVSAQNLAYVIYTSGSTGQPKGVMVTHGGLSNHMEWIGEELGMSGNDRLLQKTPLSFDASVWEFYAPLQVGGALVMARPAGHQDVDYLVEVINREQVSVLQVTPVLLRALLEQERISECGSLRRLLCGGEALAAVEVEKVRQTLGLEVENLYGPTEATIDSAYWRAEEAADSKVAPIGTPISNVRVYAAGDRREETPIGVTGELYIAGAGLARGYLGRPDLTAEMFVPDVYGAAGERAYRTGDQVRYLTDGKIEYLGRIDNQVKVRGYRIELGEVEAALRRQEAVADAVVVVREDVAGGRQLVGYYVTEGGKNLSESELREFLLEKLPEYMAPATYVQLERMPLTPNGKIDRKALRAPGRDDATLEKTFLAPRDNLECELAQIWEEILETGPVGVRDNFFALGGHSLLAARLIARIKQKLDKKLPLTSLFHEATVEHLANLIRQQEGITSWSPLVNLQPRGSKPPLFCVHPVGGQVFCYADLARHLGQDRPFYGFQAQA